MPENKPTKTGERFIPSDSNKTEVAVNIERYLFALHHLEDKTVLDLGCGAGLGSYLYSLVAKKVYAVDYDPIALESVEAFSAIVGHRIETQKLDITDPDVKFPEVDVCVALEVLEHIEDPLSVLKKLNAKELIFSLPLSSLANSSWHKYEIRGGEEGMEDIKKLIGKYYRVEEYNLQYDRWVFGHGIRRKSWL